MPGVRCHVKLPPIFLPADAFATPPEPHDGHGTLGALDDLYYRRVWQWSSKWDVVAEGYVRGYGPNCTFEGPTFCSIGPPWVYEVWHKYTPHTFGTGGDWDFAGERKNW